MLYAERLQQMHLVRVPIEMMANNVTGTPRIDFCAHTCIHKPIVRCNAVDIVRMQATYANQSEMIATVHMEDTANTCYNDILLSTGGEAHCGRHTITNQAQRTMPLK